MKPKHQKEFVAAECSNRKAFTPIGNAWWYAGRDAFHFHRDDGTWVTVRTSAIRKALAAMDRQLAKRGMK